MTTRRHDRWYGVAASLVLAASACTTMRPAEPGPEPVGIAAARQCVDATPDRDGDGLADACEEALAAAFAPVLMIHATRCTPPSPTVSERIPGGYFHAAQPTQGIVRLVYLPAYYRDCGWRGARCLLFDCRGHAGDSEVIAIDVRRLANGAWATEAVFLSAHCFGSITQDCRWYRDDDLAGFEWVDDIRGGVPIVWVSDARNANYPSHGACERGHARIDGCDRDSVPFRFPVSAERNIGSRTMPITQPGQSPGCVNGAFVEPADPLIVSPAAVECFWSRSAPFLGWQGGGTGATAYVRYLDHLGL